MVRILEVFVASPIKGPVVFGARGLVRGRSETYHEYQH